MYQFMVALALDCRRWLFNNLGEWAAINSFFNLSAAVVVCIITRRVVSFLGEGSCRYSRFSDRSCLLRAQ
ncbi:hypothetical protein ACVWXN_003262 [Bradyrhizobium sp. i1.4.4]|jgi:hypothetical protein